MAQFVQPSDEQLRACCAADTWVRTMSASRPFPSAEAALALSDDIVLGLDTAGLDQALAAHARIGERRTGTSTEDRGSRSEQAGALAVDDDVQARLVEANRRYEQRFGRVFLIRAAGRSGEEMLAALEQRLGHDDDTELDVVRRELADIVRLRLEKVVSTGSTTRDGSTTRVRGRRS
jgi:2-oxo-4-hydroxy-4-carboxy-5-ureidoimidazoline decarboxylase